MLLLNLGSKTLRLTQNNDSLESGTSVWEGGIELARFFHHGGPELHGKSCLDLGSGTGIVGIACAFLGANTVVTDISAVLSILKMNVSTNMNEVVGTLSVAELDWKTTDLLEFKSMQYDIITGADVVYNMEACPILVNCIAEITNPKTRVYIAHEDRDPLVSLEFVKLMKEKGFKMKKMKVRHSDPNEHELWVCSPLRILDNINDKQVEHDNINSTIHQVMQQMSEQSSSDPPPYPDDLFDVKVLMEGFKDALNYVKECKEEHERELLQNVKTLGCVIILAITAYLRKNGHLAVTDNFRIRLSGTCIIVNGETCGDSRVLDTAKQFHFYGTWSTIGISNFYFSELKEFLKDTFTVVRESSVKFRELVISRINLSTD